MTSLDFQLYGKQFDFLTCDARAVSYVGGIGAGKTLAGSVRALLASQGQIGSHRIPTPNLGVVTAPTYPMLRDATVRTFIEVAGDLIAEHNKSEATMKMVNGSEILFRSTEHPERLRGPTISWWFGDEAALYTERVWKIMLGRLRQYGQRGFAWLATTPKGRNWIWQKFVQAGRASYALFTVATWENPFLSDDYILSLMEEYSGDFARQELEGEFVGFEGLIYPAFDRLTHVVSSEPARFVYTAAGVDWGFAHPGVILVGGVDGDGRVHIVHEEYQRRRRIEEWVEVAKQLRDTWGIQAWYCDPSEPDYIKAFKNAGLRGVSEANNAVNPGIQEVSNRLVRRADGRARLTLAPGCVWTAAEFEQYQWAENRDGLRDEPKKANDHALDALRYLAMGVSGKERKGTVVVENEQWA